jgi:hypothetical protein
MTDADGLDLVAIDLVHAHAEWSLRLAMLCLAFHGIVSACTSVITACPMCTPGTETIGPFVDVVTGARLRSRQAGLVQT